MGASAIPLVPLRDGPQRVRDDRGETGSISLQRQSSCPSRPRHYVFAKPDPPSRQLGDGLWKVLMTAHDRVDPLPSQSEHVRDLSGTDQIECHATNLPAAWDRNAGPWVLAIDDRN